MAARRIFAILAIFSLAPSEGRWVKRLKSGDQSITAGISQQRSIHQHLSNKSNGVSEVSHVSQASTNERAPQFCETAPWNQHAVQQKSGKVVQGSPESHWEIKPTNTLLHRLRSLGTISIIAQQAKKGLLITWNTDNDCPVMFEEVFGAPVLQMSSNADICPKWQPLRSPRGACRFLVPKKRVAYQHGEVGDPGCFETSNTALGPAFGTAWWFRQLRPSEEVLRRVKASSQKLEWETYTWVAVHIMDPLLRVALPDPKPIPLNQTKQMGTIRDIAPFSAYMYEMMAAKHRLSKNQTLEKPIRFLLVGQADAVRGLKELAGPAFQGQAQLVPLPGHGRAPLTLGRNSREGLLASAATMFLLLKAEMFIYVAHSTFGDIVARASQYGKTVQIGELPKAPIQTMGRRKTTSDSL